MQGNAETAVRAMKAGALEFFAKPLAEELLLDALCHGFERTPRYDMKLALAARQKVKQHGIDPNRILRTC